MLAKQQKYQDTGEIIEHQHDEHGHVCMHDKQGIVSGNHVAIIVNQLLNEAFLEVFDSYEKFKRDQDNKEIVQRLKEAITASSPCRGQDPNHVYLSPAIDSS